MKQTILLQSMSLITIKTLIYIIMTGFININSLYKTNVMKCQQKTVVLMHSPLMAITIMLADWPSFR